MAPKRVALKQRCTVAQKNALVDYMSKHIPLARYELDAITADDEWHRLAETLNTCGTVKTVEAWKITWRDLRRKASKDRADALASDSVINEASKKILDIITTDEDPTNETPEWSNTHYEEDQEQQQESSFASVKDLARDNESPARVRKDRASSPASEIESIQDPPESSFDSSPSTSPTPTNKTRCTQDQIHSLVDCMAINSSMAFGRQNTPKNAADWKRLRQFLNRMGPAKRTVAWQKTWRDLKRNAILSSKVKTAWTKPTTQKIMEILATHTEKNKNQSQEVTIDEADLLLQPDGESLSPQYLSPQEESKLNTEKYKSNKRSPARRSTVVSSPPSSLGKMSPEHNSDESSAPDNEAHEYEQVSEGKSKKMRCTNAQKYALVDYMAQHPSLATSRQKADGDPHFAEWRQLSKYLNKIGTAKTTKSWKRTWREMKKQAFTSKKHRQATSDRWMKLNEKVRDIYASAATVKDDPMDTIVKTVEEFDGRSPSPTDDMPLLCLKNPDNHFSEIALSENDLSDVSEPNDHQKHNAESPKPSPLSPESRGSMSPRERSRKASPVQSEDGHSQEADSSMKTRPRCTPTQIHALIKYMANHPGLATAKCLYMPKAKDPRYKEWQRLGRYLNTLNKNGPPRTTASWKVTWRSLIIRARKKESKLSPSYETIYRKVLKIHDAGRTNKKPIVRKVKTKQEFPTQLQFPPDPLNLKYEQDHTDVSEPSKQNRMSPERRNSDGMSPMQRGSRLSPMRCMSDQMSPVRRSSDRLSPGCSSEVAAHRPSLTSSAMDVDDTSLVDLENELNYSREQCGWKPRKMRSSNSQLRALADYMIAHPHLATDKYIDHRQPAWVRLARYLNGIGPARKRTEAWKRTWRDIKNGVRARGRTQASKPSCLESFREQKVLELIGMASPSRNNTAEAGETIEEVYVVPEPEIVLTQGPDSPYTEYNFSENLAQSSPRNDCPAKNERVTANAPSTEETASPNDMSSFLQALLKEVRRSNELNVAQNGYLRDILKELRTSNNRTSRQTGRESPGHGNHSEAAVVQNEEVIENTTEVTMVTDADRRHCNDVKDSGNGTPAKSPAIKPVSLSSLTSATTQKQDCKRVDIQSILRAKLKGSVPKGKLVRLQNGTMVLVPDIVKMKTAADHDENGVKQIYVMGDDKDGKKSEAKEDSLRSATANNES